jgi:hypothetical protein
MNADLDPYSDFFLSVKNIFIHECSMGFGSKCTECESQDSEAQNDLIDKAFGRSWMVLSKNINY